MSAQSTRLYHRLQITAHLIKKHTDRILLDATGLTTAQVAVLTIIGDERGGSQRSVANHLEINESAVTEMVRRLIELGFVLRTRSADDARTWALKLTPAGRGALTRAGRAFADINARFDTALDTEAFAAALDAIKTSFEQP